MANIHDMTVVYFCPQVRVAFRFRFTHGRIPPFARKTCARPVHALDFTCHESDTRTIQRRIKAEQQRSACCILSMMRRPAPLDNLLYRPRLSAIQTTLLFTCLYAIPCALNLLCCSESQSFVADE